MSKKRREIPVFDHPIIETHCHLDYLKDRPLEETLEQARGVNIEKVITIAVSPDNLARVRELSQVAPWVYGTQGIHPHDVGTILDEGRVAIRAGHHCAQPLMEALGVDATARASFAVYNGPQDIEALVKGVERVTRIFG